MEKQVYFVRHGESESNVDRVFRGKEAVLTESGRAQAAAVAERVLRLNVDALICSTFTRARETAAIIGEKIGLAPEEHETFGEWLESEHLIGKSYEHPDSVAAVEAIYGSDNPHYRHGSEETFAELKARGEACFALLEQHPAEKICVIGHMALLRIFLGILLFEEAYDKSHFLALFKHVNGSNTGITYARYDTDKKRWKLITWNDQSHLG